MVMAQYPGAIAMYVADNRVFKKQNTHAAIVIHKTGGPGNAIQQAEYFATNADWHSTHFVVGQDGQVVQCVRLEDGAGGNCCCEPGYDPFWSKYNPAMVSGGGATNLNTVTISIEHCDPSLDNSTLLTAAQKDASFKLIAWLCDRYNISVDSIKGHNSIDPKSRAHCPGNYPMDALKQYVGGHRMQVPTNWHYDGSTLVAPNNYRVVLGFANAVLSGGWPSTLIPIENEVHVKTFLFSKPDLGGGQQQLFQDQKTGACIMLCYNDAKGVFVGQVGDELMYLRNKEDNLVTQEPTPPPAPPSPQAEPAGFFEKLTAPDTSSEPDVTAQATEPAIPGLSEQEAANLRALLSKMKQ